MSWKLDEVYTADLLTTGFLKTLTQETITVLHAPQKNGKSEIVCVFPRVGKFNKKDAKHLKRMIASLEAFRLAVQTDPDAEEKLYQMAMRRTLGIQPPTEEVEG